MWFYQNQQVLQQRMRILVRLLRHECFDLMLYSSWFSNCHFLSAILNKSFSKTDVLPLRASKLAVVKPVQLPSSQSALLFLYDFFRDLYHSESKINHIKTHYIDFISSIPTFSIFRIGRIFRIIRILRLVRSGKIIYGFIDKYNAKSAFENIVILNFIVLGFSTFSVYQLEKGINPDISTLGESLWWCINTIMTVGFVQDIILISIEGKVFSIILIISGLLLFGTFISFITDYFVKDQDLKDSVNDMNSKISELEKKIDQFIKEKNN